MQRKNKLPQSSSRTMEEVDLERQQISPLITKGQSGSASLFADPAATTTTASNPDSSASPGTSAAVATVRRRQCGTSPFDKHWLNLDCCGLFCAGLTYCLHIYGCYVVCRILLPPWMSHVYDGVTGMVLEPTYPVREKGMTRAMIRDLIKQPLYPPDSVRRLTFWGWTHCLLFCAVAAMAVASHFKAMTTDPGAVPPDAAPLPNPMDRLNISHEGLEEGRSHGSGRADQVIGDDSGRDSTAAQTAAAVAAVAAAPVLVAGAALASALPPRANSSKTSVGKTFVPSRGKRICRRCHSYKPKRAHHCSVCKRCIIKMDHHCEFGCLLLNWRRLRCYASYIEYILPHDYFDPDLSFTTRSTSLPTFIHVRGLFPLIGPWVNNCVGIGNHKYFLLFVFYTFLSCTYSMTLVAARFFVCLSGPNVSRWTHGHCLDDPTFILSLVGLIIEASLFGIFTCCMMVDQWDVVTSNVTHIDRLKGLGEAMGQPGGIAKGPFITGPQEVFGTGRAAAAAKKDDRRHFASRFRYDWLSPFVNICFPAHAQDEIMGFCRPCPSNRSDIAGEIELRLCGNGANVV